MATERVKLTLAGGHDLQAALKRARIAGRRAMRRALDVSADHLRAEIMAPFPAQVLAYRLSKIRDREPED